MSNVGELSARFVLLLTQETGPENPKFRFCRLYPMGRCIGDPKPDRQSFEELPPGASSDIGAWFEVGEGPPFALVVLAMKTREGGFEQAPPSFDQVLDQQSPTPLPGGRGGTSATGVVELLLAGPANARGASSVGTTHHLVVEVKAGEE